MKEHPIIFKGEMVKAILEGRKMMTRRPIKKQPPEDTTRITLINGNWCFFGGISGDRHYLDFDQKCPYGIPEDRLWVRETWGRIYRGGIYSEDIIYKCDRPDSKELIKQWRSPIHMPRHASRITLEIINIKVERVQEITEEDAIKEGIIRREDDADSLGGYFPGNCEKAKTAFRILWNSIYNKFAWDRNEWVWAIEFKSITEAGQRGK